MGASAQLSGPQIVSDGQKPSRRPINRPGPRIAASEVRGDTVQPSLAWQGAEYPLMDAGRYLVRGLKVQGPEWVRAFSRWSIRIEFGTVHEPGVVSAFFNLGKDRTKHHK
jgi:hypothetical protein